MYLWTLDHFNFFYATHSSKKEQVVKKFYDFWKVAKMAILGNFEEAIVRQSGKKKIGF